MIGGLGCCGRSLCCSTFLGDFIPVSIRMAKDQNLSLNPVKISGICGRLMCCLKYESDYYCEQCPHEVTAIKEPTLDVRVIVDEGEGKVISINRQRRTATIILDNSKKSLLKSPVKLGCISSFLIEEEFCNIWYLKLFL